MRGINSFHKFQTFPVETCVRQEDGLQIASKLEPERTSRTAEGKGNNLRERKKLDAVKLGVISVSSEALNVIDHSFCGGPNNGRS